MIREDKIDPKAMTRDERQEYQRNKSMRAQKRKSVADLYQQQELLLDNNKASATAPNSIQYEVSDDED